MDHFQDDWSDFLPALDAAHNWTPHDSLEGVSPYELMFGREAHNPLSVPPETPSGTETETPPGQRARELVTRMHQAWAMARSASERAQERQAAQANRRRRAPDFIVGDMVMVSKRGWATDRPTTRLDSQWAGPYRIVAARGFSYEVDLPESVRVSRTFHASQLRKAPVNPLPGQRATPAPPEIVEGELEWTVNRIISSRIHRGKLQYQAEWQGCDPDPGFYDAESFKHSPVRIQEFHERHPEAEGPPKRLAQWIRAAAEDKEPEPHDDDNAAESRRSRTRRTSRRH